MYCKSCGTQLSDRAVACTTCGESPLQGRQYCQNCGQATPPHAVACTHCGGSLVVVAASELATNRIAAGICGILLGSLGVHKFILGYATEGAIMLAVTVLTCGFGGAVMGLIGLIEGIIYLVKSDEEFVEEYVNHKKGWF